MQTSANSCRPERRGEERRILEDNAQISNIGRIGASRIMTVSKNNADQCRLMQLIMTAELPSHHPSMRLVRRIRRTATAWPRQEASEDREGWTQVIHLDIACWTKALHSSGIYRGYPTSQCLKDDRRFVPRTVDAHAKISLSPA